MKAVVLLAGCGVYDGSEIHESVLTLLALDEKGISYQCAAPDIPQYHVINHLNGEEEQEKRNVLQESARIARGNVQPLSQIDADQYDALVIPGGFGAAKNLSQWAFDGPEAQLQGDVKKIILDFINAQKPILAMCVAPTAVALALKESGKKPMITLGTTEEKSPYDIAAMHDGLRAIDAQPVMSSVSGYIYDDKNKIISTPCYMQEASILEIRQSIVNAVQKLMDIS